MRTVGTWHYRTGVKNILQYVNVLSFWLLNSFLFLIHLQVTLETTIGNSNPALWKFVQPTGGVMEWLRNIVANRLAATAKEWAEIFSQYNSGTCVLHFKKKKKKNYI